MESSTKMIQLTGGAMARRPRTKRAARGQKGGSLQSDVIISKFPNAMAPAAEATCSIKGYQTPTVVHGAPLSMAYQPVMPQVPQSAVSVAASYPAFPQGQPAQMGGKSGDKSGDKSVDKSVPKVVLQTKTKTVQLGPKGIVPKGAPKGIVPKKRTRRITLRLQAVKKSQTRTNKIQAAVKDMPIAKVREHLISKNLIKSTSKAPEKVLRQMAVDAHIVAA